MGQSLEFLKDFFPNAIIYGIDLYDKKEYDSDRIITLIGNQESRYDLNNIVKQTNCEFDLIIDDGGHTMRQQQITFSVLFKNLKSNGIFIIENLHTSDREPWMNSDDEISTLNMLRYYNENNIIKSNHMTDEEKKYLENNIESIKIWSRTDDFMESVTSIIIKK
jgi:hypothetical protein